MIFSQQTLEFFDHLLSQVTLSVGAPDFDEWAGKVMVARKELAEAMPKPNREQRRAAVKANGK